MDKYFVFENARYIASMLFSHLGLHLPFFSCGLPVYIHQF